MFQNYIRPQRLINIPVYMFSAKSALYEYCLLVTYLNTLSQSHFSSELQLLLPCSKTEDFFILVTVYIVSEYHN